MKTLDFYQAYRAMDRTEFKNLDWALKKIKRLGLTRNPQEYSAWGLYLFCVTRIRTRENLAASIKLGRQIPSLFFELFALEIQQPTCEKVVIGTSGKFVTLILPDGPWGYNLLDESEETACYEISRLDLENMHGMSGNHPLYISSLN